VYYKIYFNLDIIRRFDEIIGVIAGDFRAYPLTTYNLSPPKKPDDFEECYGPELQPLLLHPKHYLPLWLRYKIACT